MSSQGRLQGLWPENGKDGAAFFKDAKAAGGVWVLESTSLMERIQWCAGKCLTVGFEEGQGLPDL